MEKLSELRIELLDLVGSPWVAGAKAASRCLSLLDEYENESGWRPIKEADKSQTLLVYYKNDNGKARTHLATYIEKFSEETCGEYCEYSEELDEYYLPEGWYEVVWNWDEFMWIAMHNEPTHFMRLPQPPCTDE